MFHYNHIYKKHNDRYIKDYGLPPKGRATSPGEKDNAR